MSRNCREDYNPINQAPLPPFQAPSSASVLESKKSRQLDTIEEVMVSMKLKLISVEQRILSMQKQMDSIQEKVEYLTTEHKKRIEPVKVPLNKELNSDAELIAEILLKCIELQGYLDKLPEDYLKRKEEPVDKMNPQSFNSNCNVNSTYSNITITPNNYNPQLYTDFYESCFLDKNVDRSMTSCCNRQWREYKGFDEKNNDLPEPWLQLFGYNAACNGDGFATALNSVLFNSEGVFKLWLETNYKKFATSSPEVFKKEFKEMFDVEPWNQLARDKNLAHIKKDESIRIYIFRINIYCSGLNSPFKMAKSFLLKNGIPDELKDTLATLESEHYNKYGVFPTGDVIEKLIITADKIVSKRKAEEIISNIIQNHSNLSNTTKFSRYNFNR